MARTIDTLLLLALPGAGKSEVRAFLRSIPPDACARDFHLGPTVQLDDFTYVNLMRQVDATLAQMGEPALFFQTPEAPFLEPRDFGTLTKLIAEDYADLKTRLVVRPASAAFYLLDRIDAARARIGLPRLSQKLDPVLRRSLCDNLERDARQWLDEKHAVYPATLSGKTVVIEMARGGPEGAPVPLPEPYGYAYTLPRLGVDILERAAVLYIAVTPEESRRRNQERARNIGAASALHHTVPLPVMLHDYGQDDLPFLLSHSDRAGTLRVQTHGRLFHVPCARLDNGLDKTSFVRCPQADWRPDAVHALHGALMGAFDELVQVGAPAWDSQSPSSFR
jgi:hypothetical protein